MILELSSFLCGKGMIKNNHLCDIDFEVLPSPQTCANAQWLGASRQIRPSCPPDGAVDRHDGLALRIGESNDTHLVNSGIETGMKAIEDWRIGIGPHLNF